jgi:hypothetical protein
MTIVESNKLIAEFMELPLVPCNIGTKDGAVTEGYQHPKVNSPCTIDGLQYKYSWDWLMPVVENILNKSDDDELIERFYEIQNVIPNREATYQAVVEFINQYNKTK